MDARDDLEALIARRGGHVKATASDILAAGYRKPRTITTAEELDALPDGAIILSGEGGYWLNTRLIDGVNCWEEPGRQGISYAVDIALPATVLHEGA